MGEFVPKYAPQAESFNGMITTNNTALSSCSQSINSLSGKINIDPATQDALAFNTLIMLKSASTAIEDKIEDNVSLGSDITAAAKRFDDEDYEEFLEEERRKAAAELARKKKAATQNGSSTETTTTTKRPYNRAFDYLEEIS